MAQICISHKNSTKPKQLETATTMLRFLVISYQSEASHIITHYQFGKFLCSHTIIHFENFPISVRYHCSPLASLRFTDGICSVSFWSLCVIDFLKAFQNINGFCTVTPYTAFEICCGYWAWWSHNFGWKNNFGVIAQYGSFYLWCHTGTQRITINPCRVYFYSSKKF